MTVKYFKYMTVFAALFANPAIADAQRTTSDGTYIGKVYSIAYGFYGEIGVHLGSQSCNGSSVVFLKKDNPQYDNIRAMILTAISSGQIVKFARLGSYGLYSNGCAIGEAAIDEWPAWN